MKLKKFNESADNINFDWNAFKNYVNTYNPKKYGNNKWHIILEDMLYGLGMSIDEDEFSGANGYAKFKQYLKDGVSWKLKKDADKYNI